MTTSRRITPWSYDSSATPLQSFIDAKIQEAYAARHPKLSETNEAVLFNSYVPSTCPVCGSESLMRYGNTSNGLKKYRCKECGKIFTSITGTIFQDHKIPVTEWIDFCLALFRTDSFTSISKLNRNSFTTTKYWLSKMFLVLEDYQDSIILSGDVYIDETDYKVIFSDIEYRPDGKEYRGQSRNQMCIGVGCDKYTTYVRYEGRGRTSKKKTWSTFKDHISPGAHLIHDMEGSHNVLIEKLGLTSEVYNSKDLKGVPDEDNPLNPVNKRCMLLQKFLDAHSGFNREDLPGYLNLFSFMMNEGPDPYFRLEKFLNIAMQCRKTLTYREKYSN